MHPNLATSIVEKNRNGLTKSYGGGDYVRKESGRKKTEKSGFRPDVSRRDRKNVVKYEKTKGGCGNGRMGRCGVFCSGGKSGISAGGADAHGKG